MSEEWDPDEIVQFEGVPLRLCLVVVRVMRVSARYRLPVTAIRDADKEPRILELPDIENLAKLPAFKKALREYGLA